MKKKSAEKMIDEVMDDPEKLAKILKDTDTLKAERWYLHSGNLSLNYVMSGLLSEGGYPSGVVEIHGDPSTGKSLLFAKAIAKAQERNIKTILADAEGRWDDDFAAINNVDAEKLDKFYPDTVEKFAVKTYDILSSIPDKYLIVLDSLAILTTLAEKKDIEDGEMKMDQGRKAQRIKAAMRVLSSEIRKTGSLLLVSNHMIAQPGGWVGKTTPGGQGVPFQANVRLQLTRPTPIKYEGKDHPIGVQLHIECDKNSVTAPYGSCDIDLYFGRGVDEYSGLLDISKDLGLVQMVGGSKPWVYGEQKFKKDEFKQICETTDLLKKEEWRKPYWLT